LRFPQQLIAIVLLKISFFFLFCYMSEQTVPADPASSLRAAALLTLKSKRRKPINDNPISQSLPSRPPPLDIPFQLDYGTEDVSPSPLDRSAITPSVPIKISMSPVSKTPAQDIQMREEGEISDEETTPLPPRKSSLEISRLRSPPHRSASAPRGRRSTPPAGPSMDPRARLSDRISGPASPSVSYVQDTVSSPMTVDTPEVPNGPLLLDADHVRPGLASPSFPFLSYISISLYTSRSEPSTV